MKQKLSQEQIFLNSIPNDFHTEKSLDKKQDIDTVANLETFIRYKTHFSFLKNASSNSKKDLSQSLIDTLTSWTKFQNLRLDFINTTFPKQHGRNFVVLKALNVFDLIEQEKYPRYHNDLDILLPKDKIFTARERLINDEQFLVGNFSFPSYEFHLNEIDQELEKRHYELSQMSKLIAPETLDLEVSKTKQGLFKNLRMPVCNYEGKFYFHLTIDLHKNISNDFTREFFWNNFVEDSEHGNYKRMPIEDLIWYSSLKMYYEVHTSADHSIKDRIRQLVDIFILLKEHGHSINWDYLIQKSELLEMQPALYYTFLFLKDYLEIFNLETVVRELNNGRIKRENRAKDYGDFSEKLFR